MKQRNSGATLFISLSMIATLCVTPGAGQTVTKSPESTGLESDRFWHYVLFFVAGQTTADVLGDPNYVPFSKAVGLTESESAAAYYKALEETWAIGGSFRDRVLAAARRVAETRQ